ncbi:MAG: PilZ domain-containing protein [Myxococcales bacterium]|jgi:hypothetical protein
MAQEVTKERKQARASVSLTVSYAEPSSARELEGCCLNLSGSGMFLGTSRPLPVGSLLKLDCEAVDGRSHIRGVARVVWVRREAAGEHRPAGMGVRFLNLEAGAQGLIDDLIARGDMGSSGRRGRSDPPEAESDSQRPRLVPVATMRQVREVQSPRGEKDSRGSASSAPPAGRKSRDASELRERWNKTRRSTRSDPPDGAARTTISSNPPPRGAAASPRPLAGSTLSSSNPAPVAVGDSFNRGLGRSTRSGMGSSPSPPPPERRSQSTHAAESPLPPPPATPRPEGAEEEGREADPDATGTHRRRAEIDENRAGATAPPESGQSIPGSADPPSSDEAAMLDDPGWRARRLAELVEAAAQQGEPDVGGVEAREEHVEEAVLVGGAIARGRARLVVVGGLLFAVAIVVTVVWTRAQPERPAADGEVDASGRVVMPEVTTDDREPATEAVYDGLGTPPEALPRGVDVPADATGKGRPEPRSSEAIADSSAESGASNGKSGRGARRRREAETKGSPASVAEVGAHAKTSPGPEKAAGSAPGVAAPASQDVPASDGSAAAPGSASAGTQDDAPASDEAGPSPLQRALRCLKSGDSACAVKALDGNARTAREWELLIESHRALGNSQAAEHRMQAYLRKFPSGQSAPTYRRLLGQETGAEPATQSEATAAQGDERESSGPAPAAPPAEPGAPE